ncbi:hypothetical protein BDZ89DRAFT_962684 [Hymenopellis radicata]|nr:hypothetical protein BDZ89DRAFT_962684 [Hymenopellis radicata]
MGVFTLNRKQRLAFLLIVNARIQRIINPQLVPFRLIVAGPGGTGKSQMYSAVKTFYAASQLFGELAFTAPTGIAASNIGGSTVSAELSLRVSDQSLMANNSPSLATLTERLQFVKTLVIDEFFFMGCHQFELSSR